MGSGAFGVEGTGQRTFAGEKRVHLPGIMQWGDISLAVAMTNARVNFICPVMSDGAGIRSKEVIAWKKEFNSVISKSLSKTIIKD